MCTAGSVIGLYWIFLAWLILVGWWVFLVRFALSLLHWVILRAASAVIFFDKYILFALLIKKRA